MPPFLEFRHVSYTYPDQDIAALHDVSFSVQPGEWVGILGANESGKSTLVKLTNGLLFSAQGEVLVNGMSVAPQTPLTTIRQQLGVVFSDPENQIVGTTVEEEVAFGLGNLGVPSTAMRARVQTYLARVGLLPYAQRPPHELSGGEQQKLCLASVFAMEPQGIVLDDPLTFLDQASQQDILNLLQDIHAAGTTLVQVSSTPEELVFVERVLLLRQGRILMERRPTALWNELTLLAQSGIEPADLMRLRHALQEHGYPLQTRSLRIEEIRQDLLQTPMP